MPRRNRIACSYSATALVESEVHAEKVSNKKGQDAALACSPRTHTHAYAEKKAAICPKSHGSEKDQGIPSNPGPRSAEAEFG